MSAAARPPGTTAIEVADLAVRNTATGNELTGDVSFRLAPGDSLAIVGESGSGKSLTARAIMGLLPPGLTANGRVQINGTSTDAAPALTEPLRGSTIALLMQDPFTMLHPLRRIGTQLADGFDRDRLRTRSARRDAAVERLAEVGLDAGIASCLPYQLSGGMRQRVGLAAALAADPSILIADEPTTALDATTQREVMRLIVRLQRERGLALVLITHDLGLAFSTCRRALVLYAGGPVECAESSPLRIRPRHPYTAALLDAEPVLDHRLASLGGVPGAVPARAENIGRCAFAPRCRHRIPACTEGQPPNEPLPGGPADHLVACIRAAELDLTHVAPAIVPDPTEIAEAAIDPVLQVTDLTKTFPGSRDPALAGVSLHLDRGEALAVIGESGSGKTTLARILVGLERADGGQVILAGLDVTDWRSLDRRRRHLARRSVQMVFQDPYSSLDPRRTVSSTLREALRAFDRPATPSDIATLLDRVQLPATTAGARPRSLSGGERQRVGIARALAADPSLLIFDEAVSALDVSVQAQILQLLNELREQGDLAVLLITHDLAVARQTTDRAMVLRAGECVEAGPTHRVLTAPTAAYTRRLLASVPDPQGTWLDSDSA